MWNNIDWTISGAGWGEGDPGTWRRSVQGAQTPPRKGGSTKQRRPYPPRMADVGGDNW